MSKNRFKAQTEIWQPKGEEILQIAKNLAIRQTIPLGGRL